jgi:D-xylose transport system substrate-binding protein
MSPRNILLVISLIMSVVIGCTLARGTRGEGGTAHDGSRRDGTRTIKIGLSMDTLKEARWQGDRDRFKSRAEALGAEVLVQAANGDDSTQIKDCESLIANHVDVLVIVPHDGRLMAKAVESAHAVGIPVIAYDRLITGCDVDLYVTFDNVEVGRQQARFLVDRLNGKGNIIRVLGAPTDNNAKLFKQGQDEVLEPYLKSGAMTIVHEDWAEDWSPINAKKIVKAAITKGISFQGLLASADGVAGGAIQALTEEKIEGTIVTGQDAELPACQKIVDGTQTMTIYKPLHLLANGAAEMAVKLAKNRPVVATAVINNGTVDVPSVLYQVLTVHKDNLCETVIADGFQPFEEVYRSLPENQRPLKPTIIKH